jgi:hypothetical protein
LGPFMAGSRLAPAAAKTAPAANHPIYGRVRSRPVLIPDKTAPAKGASARTSNTSPEEIKRTPHPNTGIAASVLLGTGTTAQRRSTLAAKLSARRQFRAAAGTLGTCQGSTALLAEMRFARIGAAALGARIAGIAAAWASALRIALITTVAAVF